MEITVGWPWLLCKCVLLQKRVSQTFFQASCFYCSATMQTLTAALHLFRSFCNPRLSQITLDACAWYSWVKLYSPQKQFACTFTYHPLISFPWIKGFFLAKRVPFTEMYPAFTSLVEFPIIAFPCLPGFTLAEEILDFHKRPLKYTFHNSANSEFERFAWILLVLLCCCPPCPLHSPQRPSTLLRYPNSHSPSHFFQLLLPNSQVQKQLELVNRPLANSGRKILYQSQWTEDWNSWEKRLRCKGMKERLRGKSM